VNLWTEEIQNRKRSEFLLYNAFKCLLEGGSKSLRIRYGGRESEKEGGVKTGGRGKYPETPGKRRIFQENPSEEGKYSLYSVKEGESV